MLAVLGAYRRPFAASVALGTVNQGSQIVASVLAAVAVARALTGAAASELTTVLAALGVAVAVRAAAAWGEGWISHELAFRILAEVRTWQYAAFERLAPAGLLDRRSGDLVNRAMSDSEAMEMFYAHTLIYVCVAVIVTPVALVATTFVHPLLAAVLAPWLLAAAVVPLRLRAHNHAHGRELRDRAAAVSTEVLDVVHGLREVLAFGRVEDRTERVRRRTRDLAAAQDRQGRRAGLEGGATAVTTTLGVLTVLVTGAVLVTDGRLTVTALPVGVVLAGGCFLPITTLLGASRVWGVTSAAADRVFALLDEPAPIPDDGCARAPARTDLRFDAVGFTYPGAAVPAVREATFAVAGGESVALVGRSGAGKSTLVALLARFHEPDTGHIRVGGTDVRDLPQETLRALVGYVPQEVFLFNASLGDNLRLAAPDATDAQLHEALGAALLAELVNSLPRGLDTPVGERGLRLSGGERQRVAIARALLHDAPVLVLDEAVSMLDPLAERALSDAIERARRGRTSLLIAHRLSTILTADRIVVVDAGTIVATGTHEQLLDGSPTYRRLIEPQLAPNGRP